MISSPPPPPIGIIHIQLDLTVSIMYDFFFVPSVDVAAPGGGNAGVWKPDPGHERVEESDNIRWIQSSGPGHKVSLIPQPIPIAAIPLVL